MHRVCPRHRVELLVVGDELRCPATPHEVRGWLVVDRHGRMWAAATPRWVCLRSELEWPVPIRREVARAVEAYPPAA